MREEAATLLQACALVRFMTPEGAVTGIQARLPPQYCTPPQGGTARSATPGRSLSGQTNRVPGSGSSPSFHSHIPWQSMPDRRKRGTTNPACGPTTV